MKDLTMNIMKRAALGASLLGVLAIAACTSTSQVSTVAGLQTAYIGAVDVDNAYAALPTHSATVLKQIGVYRVAAFNALQPLVVAAECVPTSTTPCASVITAAETEAAETAVSQLTAYLVANNITPTSSTASAAATGSTL